jgi:uncharacterized protein YutE (UPF0331/DUF86 family)
MVDDVVLNKAATIERCLDRIAQEYQGHENELETNFTRQDAVVLNVLRACEACIDIAMHIARSHRLGLPQESRDAFRLMEQAGMIPTGLSVQMQKMVGFRNIAVHDYQKLSLPILRSILNNRLGDFRHYVHAAIDISSKRA